MARIQDMPIELLYIIFNILCRACKDDGYDSDSEEEELDRQYGLPDFFSRQSQLVPLHEMQWIDAPERSAAKYPFNAANVCTLWQDVLLDSPVNWTHLVFDLAQDPRPLMGTFAASSHLLFSVLVFTTEKDNTEEVKTRENNRARIIVRHLKQHTIRCTSIVFDLKFASSLPSPVTFLRHNPPELENLSLDYQIYDLPLCYEGTHIRRTPVPPTSGHKLSTMSMSGSAFMDLIHLGLEWLEAFKENISDGTYLSLSDFQFPARNSAMVDIDYTVGNFICLLFHFNAYIGLRLNNFSTAYSPHNRNVAASLYDFPGHYWSEVYFTNVSNNMLAEFFQHEQKWGAIEFHNCSIPVFSSALSAGFIIVEDLPDLGLSTESSYVDHSLYNLLSSWKDPDLDSNELGLSLNLQKCPAFDDNFIKWLCENRGDGECEAQGLRSLCIMDCPNFSVAAIKQLITALESKVEGEWPEDRARLTALHIYGNVPLLTDEDQGWFNTYCKHLMLRWNATDTARS